MVYSCISIFTENINSTFTIRSNMRFVNYIIYRKMNTFTPSTEGKFIRGTFKNNFRNRFSVRFVERIRSRFSKKNCNRFYKTEHCYNQKKSQEQAEMLADESQHCLMRL